MRHCGVGYSRRPRRRVVVSGTERMQRVVEHVGVTAVFPLLQTAPRGTHAAQAVGHRAATVQEADTCSAAQNITRLLPATSPCPEPPDSVSHPHILHNILEHILMLPSTYA